MKNDEQHICDACDGNGGGGGGDCGNVYWMNIPKVWWDIYLIYDR